MVNVAPEMSAGRSLIGAGALGEVAALHGNFAEACRVRLRDHGRDHAVFHGHGDADIDVADAGECPRQSNWH